MKIQWTGELTPAQERNAFLAGVVIGLTGCALYAVKSHLNKKASDRRVAQMVAAKMPEVDAYIGRLQTQLDKALEKQRQHGQDILARVDEATRGKEL